MVVLCQLNGTVQRDARADAGDDVQTPADAAAHRTEPNTSQRDGGICAKAQIVWGRPYENGLSCPTGQGMGTIVANIPHPGSRSAARCGAAAYGGGCATETAR